jgi:hypothetical protein
MPWTVEQLLFIVLLVVAISVLMFVLTGTLNAAQSSAPSIPIPFG